MDTQLDRVGVHLFEVVPHLAPVDATVHDLHLGEAERACPLGDAVVPALLIHGLVVMVPLHAHRLLATLGPARQPQPLVVHHRLVARRRRQSQLWKKHKPLCGQQQVNLGSLAQVVFSYRSAGQLVLSC